MKRDIGIVFMLFITIMSACTCKEPGQDYIPTLKDGNQWVYHVKMATNPEVYDNEFYLTQVVVGDTIINDIEYKIIANIVEEGVEILTFPQNFYYKEDNGKIYQEETLMYDFGLDVNDATDYCQSIHGNGIVESVSYQKTIDNKIRKFLNISVTYQDNEYYNDTWVEGIGSLQSGLLHNTTNLYGSNITLIKFISDDKIVFEKN